MNRALCVATMMAAGWMLAGCEPDLTNDPAQAGIMEEAASSRSEIIGQTAPQFSLADQDSQIVRLSDLRGKWLVLYFYPADDTPGCTCQATEFTELLSDFCQMDAQIFGVSTDSIDSHRYFIEKYDLKLNLLSDPDHAVMQQYGAWVASRLGEQEYGRVIRTTLIIDPEGVIRHHWPEVIPVGHAERVRDKLEDLQQPD